MSVRLIGLLDKFIFYSTEALLAVACFMYVLYYLFLQDFCFNKIALE